jgi:hypothetical protein
MQGPTPTPAKPTTRGVAAAFDLLTVVLFVAALAAPAVDCCLRSDKERGPERECRFPAPRPEMPRSFGGLMAWPARYEAYWKDSFGLRDVLLRWHSIAKVLWLGVSPDPNHIVGKDLWIYNDNNSIADNWRGAIPLSAADLVKWQQRIERRRDAVAALGGHYLICFVPDKPEIYPEHMPERLNKLGPSRLDQLLEHMRAHSDADIFDIRPALRAERAHDVPGDYVYWKLGTHWQRRGAIAGFNALVEHLRPRFPNLRFRRPDEYLVHSDFDLATGDRETNNMYIGDLVPEANHGRYLLKPSARVVLEKDRPPHVETETGDPSLPRVLVFHDSFAPAFHPEWAETCSRLVFQHSHDFDMGLIETERPDLVIEFIVERCLVTLIPDQRTEHETESVRIAFERAETLATVDGSATPMLAGLAKGRLSVQNDETGPFVELSSTGGKDSFVILKNFGESPRKLVARIDIEVPSRERLSLYYKRVTDRDWSPERRVAAVVVPGRNTVYLEIPAGDSAIEGLVFQPLESAGSCRLRSLEVRALPAGK